MSATISRRHFLSTLGAATAAGCVLGRSRAADAGGDNIRLGMMLQGASLAELQARAKAVAGVGFQRVQVTFFFHPTADELKTLAQTLSELKLQTVAFGTYFNLFRPDDASFMRSSRATMQVVAAHAELLGCKQFVTWSASYARGFAAADPRNHTPAAVAELQRAVREVLLPIIAPIGGRVAFEPYFPHVVGTVELANEVLAPFAAQGIGLLLDPPNFISADLYPRRQQELQHALAELGDRIQMVHLKDMKLNPSGRSVDLPGPGGGEMNYPLLIAGLRQLGRPLNCIIEHIKCEPAEMSRTKAWVEAQLARR